MFVEALYQKTGISLNEADQQLFTTQKVLYQKRQVITAQGKVEEYIYFIESGAIKISYELQRKNIYSTSFSHMTSSLLLVLLLPARLHRLLLLLSRTPLFTG